MGDGLRRSAGKFPRKIAAKDRYRQITYGDLNGRVNQLAHGLLALGVRKGDAVAISVGNRIEHLEIIFAAAKIGALAIPLDIKWKALELASVLSAFEPRFIVLQEDCMEEFARARSLKDLSFIKPVSLSADGSYGGLMTGQSADEPNADVKEDDPFAVMLTSGTTGFPKGCLATHRTFVFHCINNAIEKGLGAHDTAILSSPIYFNAGRSFTLGIIYFGGTMILHERFDAEEVLSHGDRAQRVERAASGDDDRKDGSRRRDLMTLIVENDLAGIDVIEALRDERRDFGCSRVVAIYDDGAERHGL